MFFNRNRNSFDDYEDEIDTNNRFNLGKFKLPLIIGGIVLFIVVILLLVFNKRDNYLLDDDYWEDDEYIASDEYDYPINYYVSLRGSQVITMYKGDEYIEPGYKGFDNRGNKLTGRVMVTSNLDTSKVGNYEITYTLKGVSKTRNVSVIEKVVGNTTIYLKGDTTIYLPKGEEYKEPGYTVNDTIDNDLTDKVEVTNNININKVGTYKVVYTVVNSSGITTSKTRKVIVMGSSVGLSLSTYDYTNSYVNIDLYVSDSYYDYTVLPNGEKIDSKRYTYRVDNNGTYKFTVYNQHGMVKEESITVSNIDKTKPTATCTIDENGLNGSTINIKASDKSGIQKYVYSSVSYTKKDIVLSKRIGSANVLVYDKAGNFINISCKNNQSGGTSGEVVNPPSNGKKPVITSISSDGVIVNIGATKGDGDITGYYFSYNNTRPDKNGGYLATSKNQIDVVRLPGTTYVWVEDKLGNISEAKSITLSSGVLLDTTNTEKYPILKQSLSSFLSSKGWSIGELNNLIARSVRAAGLHTKTAAATSAVALQTVLAQKYKIKLPYWWGGKYYSIGANSSWGSNRTITANGTTYNYYGLDCTGFMNWAYVQAGYNIDSSNWSYLQLKDYTYNKANGEIGDFLVNSTHGILIIGKTDSGFITAESQGNASGMLITTRSYSNSGDFVISKGEEFVQRYSTQISLSNYPSGY